MDKDTSLLHLFKTPKEKALAHPILRKCCPDEWLELDFGFLGPAPQDGFAKRKSPYLLYGIMTEDTLKAHGLDKNDIVVLDKYKKPAPNDKIVVRGTHGTTVQKIIKQGSYRYAMALCHDDKDLGCLWRENFIGVIVKIVKGIALKHP